MSGAKAFIEKNCNSLAKQFLFLFIYALHLAMYRYLIKWKRIPQKMLEYTAKSYMLRVIKKVMQCMIS